MTRAPLTARSVVAALTPAYTDKAVLPRIAAAYRANNPASVQLQTFLAPDAAKKLHAAIAQAKWKTAIIADRYSRDEAALPAAANKLLTDAGVLAFIKAVTGTRVTTMRLERYGHRDYTLRNDEEKPLGLLAYLDWTADWDASWGGSTIIPEESGEAMHVTPLANTLVLVDCSQHYPFVKYINHDAKQRAIVRIVFS